MSCVSLVGLLGIAGVRVASATGVCAGCMNCKGSWVMISRLMAMGLELSVGLVLQKQNVDVVID